jgi:hypothetical protein
VKAVSIAATLTESAVFCDTGEVILFGVFGELKHLSFPVSSTKIFASGNCIFALKKHSRGNDKVPLAVYEASDCSIIMKSPGNTTMLRAKENWYSCTVCLIVG